MGFKGAVKLAFLGFVLGAPSSAVAQDTLQVTYTTERWDQAGHLCFYDQDLSNGLDQQNRNVTVVWLEDANTGDFVRTLHRRGQNYVYNLESWAVGSRMAMDAVSQASERCYSGETCGSGGNRVTAPPRIDTGVVDISDLPDGTYNLRIEVSSCEVSDAYRGGGATYESPDATFSFTKGRNSQLDVQLGDAFPFGGVRLDYRASTNDAPPGVWAGSDQSIVPSGTSASVSLTGVATDDGAAPSLQWSMVGVEPAGGSAMFSAPTAATTDVSFTTSGIYTLRLTATDGGGQTSSDDVVVNVNVHVLEAVADAEVHSGSPNRTYGTLVSNPPASYTAGTWVYIWGPNNVSPCNANNQNRSRGYFRFDLSTVSGTIDLARMRLPVASQRRETAKWHDFFMLADVDDDWVASAPDDELSVSWANQPVAGGDEATLGGQLVGSYQHRMDYNTWAEIDLDLATIATMDFNDTWTVFGAPRQRCNGMGIASRENAVKPELVVVEHWQGGMNTPPVADAGPDQSVIDADGNGTASVTLDGSGSTDDIAIITYSWAIGGQVLATTESATLDLDLGRHTVELTVTDGAQASSMDSVVVQVDDRYHPNADSGSATPIDGNAGGKRYDNLFVHPATGGDWFSLDLAGGGDLTIVAEPMAGTVELTLYGPDGTSVLDMSSGTNAVTVQQTGLSPATYFAQVAVLGGAAEAASYALVVTVDGNGLDLTFSPTEASESVGTLVGAGTVSLPAAAGNDITVDLTSSDPSRLTPASPTVVVPAGSTSATFDLTVVDDAMQNGNLDVTVRATAAGYNAGSASFLVIDDDGAGPRVAWMDAMQSSPETRNPLIIATARLSEASGSDVVVPFTIGGDATPGEDFDDEPLASGMLTIPAGRTSVQVIFSLIDDQVAEDTETVTLTLGTPAGAVTGTPAVFTLEIIDDEEPVTTDPPGDKTMDDDMIVGGCACSTHVRRTGTGVLVWLGMLLLLRRWRR